MIEISGSMYDNYKGSWRCLFNECTATIRKTDEEWVYQLIVNRHVDDGEDLDDDEVEQYVFDMDESMKLASEIGPCLNSGFSFTNTDDDSGKSTRFLVEVDAKVKAHMSDLFERTACQCIYEAKYRRSSDSASDDAIFSFCSALKTSSSLSSSSSSSSAHGKSSALNKSSSPAKPSSSSLYPSTITPPASPPPYIPSSSKHPSTPSSSSSSSTTTSTPSSKYYQSTPSSSKHYQATPSSTTTSTPSSLPYKTNTPPTRTATPATPIDPYGYPSPSSSPFKSSFNTPSPSSPSPSSRTTPLPSPSKIVTEGVEELVVEPARLLRLNDSQQFEIKEPIVKVAIHYTGDEEDISYKMYIKKQDDTIVYAQEIDNEMYPSFITERLAVEWNFVVGTICWTWSLEFESEQDSDEFLNKFAVCLWEVNNHVVSRARKKREIF
eukprot:TRINITY_DN2832_c0_g1_i5.p1 TRINITY_DN2832_c0_g1~~TRINITY_DN2832_c0_g1_i5.p1  ORF type:complete len:436 (+),score=179.10 TRINITY_DN2832_c0_g1_i5:160-1467(+)